MKTSPSDALVLFGVTGDLAHKMIFPALYAMVKRGTLRVPIIGVALPKWSLSRLHKRVTESIERSGGVDSQRGLHHLLSLLKYVIWPPRENSMASRGLCSRRTRSSASTISSERRRS